EELKKELEGRLKAEKKPPEKAPNRAPSPPDKRPSTPASQAKSGESKAKQAIKVPQERLDKLMNLIGELVVMKNNFASLAREVSVDYDIPALAQKIKEFGEGVSRIVDELQATIMSVRMVPVGQIFSRFPRMVRDLSRKLSKKIRLEISGEETELDKTIIEALGDPMVHLIRNAADHGLETPEERKKVGKPEEGTIWLKAYNKGQSVIIEIEDDGRGIDPNRIRAKALEKGLISPEDIERLNDKQIINLIFQPGFSTADKVSEVSGRGVGMDVVRTAIEKIGGSVELESHLGQGTKVILKLPLTLAISKGLEVESAGERYYIPIDYVVETVKAPREAIHWHRGQALVLIRGYLLPLFDLGELLGAPKAVFPEEDNGEIPLVVLNLGAKRLALKVDRFYNESEFVLKPLAGLLEGLPGFSGATVTGEGRILLVLDPPKLLN
ncbi:chemotaxis protein CheA, partial [Thermosulfuriphilus sp.]